MAGRSVLMLSSTLPRWADDATPRFVLDLATSLAERDWKIEILAPGTLGARAAEEIDGIRITRFRYAWPERLQTLCYNGGIMPNLCAQPARFALVPPFFASAIAATRRRIAALKPDLVHAHWIVPMGLTAVLAAPRGTPLVLTVHGSDALDLKGSLLKGLKRFVLARADAVTCNGSRTEAAIAPLLPTGKTLARIPMGARRAEAGTEHGIELPAGRFIVLFAGRLFRGKGLDDLLEAIAGFDAGARPLLLIAGTGSESDRFVARASSLGIADDVRFLGGVEHKCLLALMRDVNAVVVPTRNTEWIEAQGLVTAEAMFAGTPVIATTGGGAEDQIENERTGLLVLPSSHTALGRAIAKLMAEPDRTRAMAQAAEAYANGHLSWGTSAGAFEAVYQSILKQRDAGWQTFQPG